MASNHGFQVSKVYPDPKRVVLIHFWGIWGHLDVLQQRYLVKTSIWQKPDFRKKSHKESPRPPGAIFKWFGIFPHLPRYPGGVKNCQKKIGWDFPCINVYFFFRISRKNLKPFSKIFFFILAYLSTLTFIQFSEKKILNFFLPQNWCFPIFSWIGETKWDSGDDIDVYGEYFNIWSNLNLKKICSKMKWHFKHI